jgi:hypothetical protein
VSAWDGGFRTGSARVARTAREISAVIIVKSHGKRFVFSVKRCSMKFVLDCISFWRADAKPTWPEWRARREWERRERRIVHKVKTEWIFSGTVRGDNGAMQDAGFLRSPYPMRRAQALRYFARQTPNAKILHIDDKNKIITYSF